MQSVLSKVTRRLSSDPAVAELQTSLLRRLSIATLVLCAAWAAVAVIVRAGWWSDG